MNGSLRRLILPLALATLILSACSSPERGTDSQYATEPKSQPLPACASCHVTGGNLDPIVLAGAGAEGKHQLHVGTRALDCTVCHAGYADKTTHINGTVDSAADSGVALVAFDTANSGGVWSDAAGTCADTACHGGAGSLADWRTTAVPLPCSDCHLAGGSFDPLIYNPNDQHQRHVTDLNQPCINCHAGNRERPTHANGTFEVGDPAVTTVFFNSNIAGGSWKNVTGPGTGTCSNTYCHAQNTDIAWYTFDPTFTCTNCHVPGFGSMDPLKYNGSGTSGKHAFHVTTKGLTCATCHKGYSAQLTHANGTFNSAAASDFLINFDRTKETTAVWSGDTGAGTGGCGTVTCHQVGGTSNLWYSP